MTQETFTFKVIIIIIIMPRGSWKTVHFYYNLCDSIIRQLQLRIKHFNQFLGIYKWTWSGPQIMVGWLMKKSIQSPATGTLLGLVEFWLSTRVEICWSSILQYIWHSWSSCNNHGFEDELILAFMFRCKGCLLHSFVTAFDTSRKTLICFSRRRGMFLGDMILIWLIILLGHVFTRRLV